MVYFRPWTSIFNEYGCPWYSRDRWSSCLNQKLLKLKTTIFLYLSRFISISIHENNRVVNRCFHSSVKSTKRSRRKYLLAVPATRFTGGWPLAQPPTPAGVLPLKTYYLKHKISFNFFNKNTFHLLVFYSRISSDI